MFDDKRLIPLYGPDFWSERRSERRRHYCKYCHRRVPTFRFSEGRMGEQAPLQVLRCCWECGSGVERLIARRQAEPDIRIMLLCMAVSACITIGGLVALGMWIHG